MKLKPLSSIVIASLFPALVVSAQNSDHKLINAYYAQWKIYSGFTVKDLDTSGTARHLDILSYAFVNIGTNAQGQYECTSFDSWADNGTAAAASANTSVDRKQLPSNGLTGNFGQLLLLKQKYPNLKIVITIGGASLPPQAFSAAAATSSSRKHFVASCLSDYIQGNFSGAFGQTPNQWESGRAVQGPPGPAVPNTPGLFDGIEIDWEYPTAADTANFTALMEEFRDQLDALSRRSKYILTFDAPAGEQNFTNINLAAVSRYVNYIDLMTYDYNGPWNNYTGFVAPLYKTKYDPYSTLNIDYTVESYIASGVSPEKILLGIPFYGYGWTVTANTNPEGQFDMGTALAGAGSTQNYNYIKTTLEPNSQMFRDNTHEWRRFANAMALRWRHFLDVRRCRIHLSKDAVRAAQESRRRIRVGDQRRSSGRPSTQVDVRGFEWAPALLTVVGYRSLNPPSTANTWAVMKSGAVKKK